MALKADIGKRVICCTIMIALLSFAGYGQTMDDSSRSFSSLKKMSLEELMNIKVTSVSRHPEKLTEVASAIQVITEEDIRRSGARNLPEALRLAPNLQVAQLNAHAWIISARGFNAPFSNKLLVMIDGRTVYSPLFAGVFWDAQGVLLEDISRIEVVSGPGGTLWGSNAVNGVINIITKNTKKTQGLYVSAAAGTSLQDFGAVRFGGKVGNDLTYRVYVQRNNYDSTTLPNGKKNADKWGMTQGGFRMDWTSAKTNTFMVEGNLYGGNEMTSPTNSPMDGQNIEGRWIHKINEGSDLTIRTYFDRAWRKDIPSTITDELTTYDLDILHNFSIGKHNDLLWGAGYRFMHDKDEHSTVFVGFLPPIKDMYLANAFVQDEISSLDSNFKFTIGTKLLYNNYSHFEIQPSARIAWIPNSQNTVWAAVSRAVRTPSRIDVDYYIPTYPVSPSTQHVAGGPDFVSESVVAYELGYRVQPSSKAFISLALFYNQYFDLYSVEALPRTLTYEIQNGSIGYTRGIELSGNYQLLKNWHLRGGYTYFYKTIENKPGHTTTDFSNLGNDPNHSFLLQSIADLPGNFQFDVLFRYSGRRPEIYTPDYSTVDIHLAWTHKFLELSVTGQNLFAPEHYEYSTQTQVPKSIYGKLTCRF